MIYAYVGGLFLILAGIVLGAIALGIVAGPGAVLGFLGTTSAIAGILLGIAAARAEEGEEQ